MRKNTVTLILCMMFILPGCINSDNETANIFHGDIISDARPISDFTLLTSDNTSYDFKENTKGKVTVIAFLFTNCYDICPVLTCNRCVVFWQAQCLSGHCQRIWQVLSDKNRGWLLSKPALFGPIEPLP